MSRLTLTALAVAACAAAVAAAGARPAETRRAGGEIAFTSSFTRVFQLYVMTEAGTGRRPLTSGPHAKGHPAWTRDGTRLAFQRTELGRIGQRSELHVLTLPRGRMTRVRTGLPVSAWPEWSPDGRRLVFAGSRSPRSRRYDLYVVAPPRGRPRKLRSGGAFPAWSPDGRRIAFTWNGALHVMDADGRRVRRLTAGLTRDFADSNPAWSPDGRWLAFDRSFRVGQAAIYRIRPSGKGLYRLTKKTGNAADPSWSPDGRRIAYVGYVGSELASEIFVMDARGTGRRRLTHSADFDGEPAWRPPR